MIDRIESDKTSSFKKIFENHKDSVISICYRLVENRDEAEDLCQEVFFKVYKSLSTFKHRSKLSTWIYRIAVNKALNHLRKKKQLRRISGSPPYNPTVPEDYSMMTAPPCEQPDLFFEKKERDKIVWKAVHTLPKNQRVALILQKYEGFSCQEIAEIMDCTLSSVQSLIHRAKENLYKKLLPFLREI